MNEPSKAQLTRIERTALALTRFTNERPLLKGLQKPFLHHVTQNWVNLTIGRRVFVDHPERMMDLGPDRGVLLCANHRAFFDMFITMLVLFRMRCPWIERVYFPVRSNFFYEHPVGVMMNYAIGGASMYPPIFRDRAKASLNEDALARIAGYLGERGTVVGVHPEGTRSKSDDPYTLLPAYPGIGQMVLQAKPIVVPMFILGVTNDFAGELRVTWRHDSRRTNPCILTFGEPMDYDEFLAQKPRLALYKRCADKINAEIAALGQREKRLRAQILAGELDDDPRWFWPGYRGNRAAG